MQRFRAAAPTFASALGFLDTGATIVMLPSMADSFAVPVAEIQGALSIALLTLSFLVLPAGRLVDRWGTANVGRMGLATAVLASAATAAAPSWA